MKYLLILLVLFLFHGCFYFTDSGVSTRYYNECKEYYDEKGKYVKKCPDTNIVEYKDFD